MEKIRVFQHRKQYFGMKHNSRNTYRLVAMMSILWMIIFASSVFGQDSHTHQSRLLDKDGVEDLVELVKYDKVVKKLKLKEFDHEAQPAEDPSFSEGISGLFRAGLYFIIILLVLFILYTIFSGIKVDRKVKERIDLELEEVEDIEVIDAEAGLQQALNAENYREAVRMLFIKLLQVLTQEESINWKPEKTNRDYLKEMRTHEKSMHFENLVMAYERIWYGSEDIDAHFFNFLRADFEKFYSTEKVDVNVEE